MSKSIKENFEDLSSTAKDYFESSIAYYKLDFFKKATKVAIDSSHKLIIAFFLLISLLFLSVALSIYLGELLGNIAIGYVIVGIFYLLITILSSLFLKPILKEVILKRASKSFFNDKNQTETNNITPAPEDEFKNLQ